MEAEGGHEVSPFASGFYRSPPAIARQLVYDIGMHIGEDTQYYLAKGFRVVAVEANPELAALGSQIFASAIAAGDLQIVSAGIGKSAGRMPFYVNAHHSEWSSFDERIGSRNGCKAIIEVPVITMADLVAQYGDAFYIKMDIEGYDQIALESLAQTQCRPKYISVENGLPHMLETLVTMGYSAFKFVNQQPIPGAQSPRPAREGADIDFTFPVGSSGPFGDDAPGEWKSRDGVRKDIDAYWNNPVRDANIHGWYDLHARLP